MGEGRPGAGRPRAGAPSTKADREWFERLYVAADNGEAVVPWDRGEPHHLLERWVREQGVSGRGRRALVVGCGLPGGRPAGPAGPVGRGVRPGAGEPDRPVAPPRAAGRGRRPGAADGRPRGTLLVIAAVKDEAEDPAEGPWPLTRAEVESFAGDGLQLVRLEDFRDLDAHRWRAELRRTASGRC